MRLLKKQQQVASENLDKRVFVDGIAGTGKTTAAIERIKSLIREGAPAESILVIVPQAALAVPYVTALRRARVKNGANIHTATLGRLSFQMVDLFWPLVADESGVANPMKRPEFLSLEMVQYYMARFVAPVIDERDYFNSVRINRNRLYTQIVDNLNKAALVGFPADNIGERLKSAWDGDIEQAFIYDDAQNAADHFRQICLQHNLLDFSLQATLFRRLWQHEPFWMYLTRRYRHLIVDNIEEDTPLTHDFLMQWVPHCDSATLLYDTSAGFRRFLGADPVNADALRNLCDVSITLDNHRVMSEDVEALEAELAFSLGVTPEVRPTKGDVRAAVVYADNRYHTQMLDWAADEIAILVHEQGVPPREIVVLAAFLPDALRFSLQTRLDKRGVMHRSHRPSRALRDEPGVRTLLTLAQLAHPDWRLSPEALTVAAALTFAIEEFDPIRARLIVERLYRKGNLLPFESITDADMQQRITFVLAEQYERLRLWIETYRAEQAGVPATLDIFLTRLFGEVLSQPGFGFHQQFDAAASAANLIDSARSFRQTANRVEPALDSAYEYVRQVASGTIANLYVRDWIGEKQDAVLLTPAYTFLMGNQAVDYQFWLNIGSTGWGQRLHQPLTHPYVLSRQWLPGQRWTDSMEFEYNQNALGQLALGLVRRCRQKVYLGLSEYGEQGMEQRGPLLLAVQRMMRRLTQGGAYV